MTIPIPKESMACLQTSKTKFMINDILSSSESNNNTSSASPNHTSQNINNNSSHHHHHNHTPNSNGTSEKTASSPTSVSAAAAAAAAAMHHHFQNLPHHLLTQMQREQFGQNGRISSPEYDDGGSDCDSDEMMDDNSVCSNGELEIFFWVENVKN